MTGSDRPGFSAPGLLSGLVISCVKGYQTFLSPILPRACRFWPSCSQYAIEAVSRHGVLAGVALGTWRVLRCHPLCAGGVDPVPETLPAWLTRLSRASRPAGPAGRTPDLE